MARLISDAEIDEFNLRFTAILARGTWGSALYDVWHLQQRGARNGVYVRKWRNKHGVDGKVWHVPDVDTTTDLITNKRVSGYKFEPCHSYTGDQSLTLAGLLNLHETQEILTDRVSLVRPADCPVRKYLVDQITPLRVRSVENDRQYALIMKQLGLWTLDMATVVEPAESAESEETQVAMATHVRQRTPTWGLWA